MFCSELHWKGGAKQEGGNVSIPDELFIEPSRSEHKISVGISNQATNIGIPVAIFNCNTVEFSTAATD